MEFKRVVFLLESISQPRCIKRIKSFISNGYDVDIYGIDRNLYNINAEIDGIKIKIIDKQHNGSQYLYKTLNNLNALYSIYKIHKNNATIFYSFGISLTLSLRLIGCKNYIYEISDVLYGYSKLNIIRGLFWKIDKYLIRKSKLTVLTSEGFAKYFFKSQLPENVIIQPNKMDPKFWKSERLASVESVFKNKLIFAYVGAFRSPNTIFRFARIIGQKYPDFEFHFYGDSHITNEVKKLSDSFENVKYFGPFKNPDDLSSIYNRINVVVACYDIQDLNERICEPNKLYESLFFIKPIIVSKNTFLADRVSQFGCGFAIDASNDQSIISFLNSFSIEMAEKIINHLREIKLSEMIDDNSNNIISYLKTL